MLVHDIVVRMPSVFRVDVLVACKHTYDYNFDGCVTLPCPTIWPVRCNQKILIVVKWFKKNIHFIKLISMIYTITHGE